MNLQNKWRLRDGLNAIDRGGRKLFNIRVERSD
jgi:hypothetical protein